MPQHMNADVELFRHHLRRAPINFTTVLALMPERALTTRPVRHPPVIVASGGQLAAKRSHASAGCLRTLYTVQDSQIRCVLRDPRESSQSAWREAGAEHSTGWVLSSIQLCVFFAKHLENKVMDNPDPLQKAEGDHWRTQKPSLVARWPHEVVPHGWRT